MWVALLCNSQYCYGSSLPENEQILQQLCGKCLFLVVWELLEWNPTQIYVIPLYSMLMLWNSKKRGFILRDQKDIEISFYYLLSPQWRKLLQQLRGKCLFLVVWELLEWNPTQIYVIPLYSMLMLWNSKNRVFILHDQKAFFQCQNFLLLFTVFSAKKNFDNWLYKYIKLRFSEKAIMSKLGGRFFQNLWPSQN